MITEFSQLFDERHHTYGLLFCSFLLCNDPKSCEEHICRVDLALGEGGGGGVTLAVITLKAETKFVWPWLVGTWLKFFG